MDQVTVPQFIDNEDKILGPITVRQFVIMFVAAIILFAFFKFADFSIFLFACIVVGGGATITAFVKINGQPFHYFLLHIVETLQRPSLRVWRRSTKKDTATFHWGKSKMADEEGKDLPLPAHLQLSERKLSELSLILDTGGAYHGEYEDEKTELFHEEKGKA